MPHAKQTAKRTRNEEVVHMEPPSDHPLFQYFSRLDDLNNYIFNFSERKEISPRFTKSDHSKGIGYVCLWTKIFKHLGIHFSNESGRMLAPQHVIDTRALNHMGRNIQREEEEQAPPPQAQEQQEDQAGPSEQPSMRDMMQVLLRIEQNQANMDTHLTRVDQRLSRIE
ncbi:hypothetical protein PIB30_103843 [Stylosanthes scabra]|uniref:Uncharacterized protein n=1 Tax=Stylosanthes scabra TaxID=79078 RepID=A0ABU6TXK0_9FABA|nr:hypothetical protein [Stylosanthes scabra]